MIIGIFSGYSAATLNVFIVSSHMGPAVYYKMLLYAHCKTFHCHLAVCWQKKNQQNYASDMQ